MSFTDFQSFIFELEKQGELIRVTEPVDPELEVTEIAIRVLQEGPQLYSKMLLARMYR